MENKELELVNMVEHLQMKQRKYWGEKAKYGNSSTQLELCKKLEKQLKEYCAKRKEILANKQTALF